MSKSMAKRIAAQRPPRFVAGFSDGSGMDTVRDMSVEGATIAVTNWGCSCCEGEETQEHRDMAARIAKALNVLEAVERITVIRKDLDGAIVIGPEGWAQVQNAVGAA
jgi:hypothetical protein